MHDNAPNVPDKIGNPSSDLDHCTSKSSSGRGWRSGLENLTARSGCAAERMFMTMCAVLVLDILFTCVFRAVAMREGMRRENATSGRGSSAMEVNEDSVAPWYTPCAFAWHFSQPPSFVSARGSEGTSVVTTATD